MIKGGGISNWLVFRLSLVREVSIDVGCALFFLLSGRCGVRSGFIKKNKVKGAVSFNLGLYIILLFKF